MSAWGRVQGVKDTVGRISTVETPVFRPTHTILTAADLDAFGYECQVERHARP